MLVYHQLQLIRKLANRYTAATWTCRQRHDRFSTLAIPQILNVRRLQASRDQTAVLIRQRYFAISAAL